MLKSLHHTFPKLTEEHYFVPAHRPAEHPSERDLQMRLDASW